MARPKCKIIAGNVVTVVTESIAGRSEERKKIKGNTRNSIYVEDIDAPFNRNGKCHDWNPNHKVYIKELCEEKNTDINTNTLVAIEKYMVYSIHHNFKQGELPQEMNILEAKFDEHWQAIEYLEKNGSPYKKYVILKGFYCEFT